MSDPSPRPPGTFKVGTIAGSDVLVTTSWFLIAALIAWTVAPRVEQVEPGPAGGRLAHLRSVVAARSGPGAAPRDVLDWRYVALLP